MKSKIFTLLVAIATSGCFASRTLPPLPGKAFAPDLEKQACEVINLASHQITTFRVLLNVQAEYKKEKNFFRYAVVGDENGKLRVEALPPKGAFAFAVLVLDEKNSVLLDVQEKKVYRAETEEELTQRFFGRVPFTKNLLRSLVSGRAPVGLCEDKRQVFSDPQSNKFVVVAGEDENRWIFDSSVGTLQEVFLGSGWRKHVIAEAHLKDFKEFARSKAGIISLPSRWSISLPEDGVTADAEVSFAKINSVVARSLFEIETPPGYAVD